MTMTAAELVASKKHILLDFDGPICAAFAGYGAANISRQLALLINQGGQPVPPELHDSPDPFELLRHAAALGDLGLLADVDSEFVRLEMQAVRIAPPTPGAIGVIRQLVRVGRTVTIVSNNSTSAIATYLNSHNIAKTVTGISARTESDPSLLKPNPHLLFEALTALGATTKDSVMVGDSPSDLIAGRVAGVAVIGLANKPSKAPVLAKLEPNALIQHITELAQ